MPWHCADVPASPKPDFGAAESVLILQTKCRRVPQPPPRRCMKSSTATNTHQHALLRRWAMKAARAGRSSRAHRFRNVGSRPRCAAALGSRARVGRPKWTDHAETWRAGRIAAKSAQVGRCAGPSMDHHLYGTGLVRPGCLPLHVGPSAAAGAPLHQGASWRVALAGWVSAARVCSPRRGLRIVRGQARRVPRDCGCMGKSDCTRRAADAGPLDHTVGRLAGKCCALAAADRRQETRGPRRLQLHVASAAVACRRFQHSRKATRLSAAGCSQAWPAARPGCLASPHTAGVSRATHGVRCGCTPASCGSSVPSARRRATGDVSTPST